MLYPIGEQSFLCIREDRQLYVDKTQYIPRLLKGKYYFLSRPRRFGKSLLISTLEHFFLGHKDLFQNLAVENYPWDWQPFPVIRLDFAGEDFTVEGNLEKFLSSIFKEYEAKYSIPRDPEATLARRFSTIIRKANEVTGKKAVILIDEYEKPILDTLDNENLNTRHANALRGLYSVLKPESPHLQFAFITGITRLGHLNIFSGLNNLRDISLDEEYAAICGITQQELEFYFTEGIEKFARKNALDVHQAKSALKRRFDGYHFSINSPDVYNPFSLLNCMATSRLGYRWYASGNPAFLYKLLKSKNQKLSDLEEIRCNASIMEGVHATISDTVTLLYQTGYLTIKDYDSAEEKYILGYPNQEVRKAFLEGLLEEFSGKSASSSESSLDRLKEYASTGDTERMMQTLEAFFADIPYDLKLEEEVNFQNVVYCLFALLGTDVKAEYHTSDGRIDLLLQTPEFIYIIEFKRDSDAEAAIAQIKAKDYAAPFRNEGKRIIFLGIDFSTLTRRISSWTSESL